MQRTLRYLCGFAGLFFLALGLAFLVSPGGQTVQFAIAPTGPGGLSTMRADMAGLFFGMAVFCLLGAVRGEIRYMAVPAMFLGFIIFGRLVNLMADGRSAVGVQSLVVEVVIAAVLFAAMWSLNTRRAAGLGGALGVPVLLLLLAAGAWVFQRPIGIAMARRNLDHALQNPLIAQLPDGLHAGLCGSGSPLPDPTRSGPCVFVIAGKRLYIVDAGDGTARKLALEGLPPGQISAMFLTHFHSDHIAGVGDMFIQRWAGASHTDPMPVYGPQGVETVVEGYNLAYSLDKGYRVAHHGEATVPPSGNGGVAHPFQLAQGLDAGQVILQQDGLTVTAFAVDHRPVVPAAGYRFDYKGRSIVISGDTAPSAVLAKYAKGADVLFHEGLQTAMVSVMQEVAAQNGRTATAKIMHDIPTYHTTPEDAARLAQQAGVRHLVFYHTIPPLPVAYFNGAFLGDAAKLYSGPITVSKDGTMVSLLPGATSVTLRELL